MIRALFMAAFMAVLCLGALSATTHASELSTSFADKLAKQTEPKPYESLAKALQNTFKKSDSNASAKSSKTGESSTYSKSSSKNQKSKFSSAKKNQKSYVKKAKNYGKQNKNVTQKAKVNSKKAKNLKTSYYKR